ncbi:MAG: hypothetical protein AAF989_05940 [Planctomycetota bacterium]
MKYRLSTVLLIATVCAVLVGWIKSRIDARDALVAAEAKFDRVRGGVRIEAEVRQLIRLSVLCDPELAEQSDDSELLHMLVFAMWQLYWYEPRIDVAYAGENCATKHGRDILTALRCTSADQFFDLTRDLYDDPEHWPEYFDVSTEAYVGYHDFVSRACGESNSR